MKTFRNSRSDIVFDAGVYLVMILGGLIVLYPLYFMVIASFSDPVSPTPDRSSCSPRELPLTVTRRYSRTPASSPATSTPSCIPLDT